MPGEGALRGRRGRGAIAWALGLVALLPIPLLAPLLTVLAMHYGGQALAGADPHLRDTARRTGRWGFTYCALAVVLTVALALLAPWLEREGVWPGAGILWLSVVLLAVHLLVCLVGVVSSLRDGHGPDLGFRWGPSDAG